MELAERKRGVNSYTLKLVAVLSMLADHIAAGFGARVFSAGQYWLMRGIGRLAFPLFCFMIAEGFFHTRSRWKYFRNLLLFAGVSEAPFDLLFWGWANRDDGMNVFWTLSLGLLAVTAADFYTEQFQKMKIAKPVTAFCALVPVAALSALAQWMKTDYGAAGVLLIVLIRYAESLSPLLERRTRNPQLAKNILASCAVVLWAAAFDLWRGWLIEFYGSISIVFLLCYNGERGRYHLSKWFFYGFYPVHLTILWLLREYLL